MAASGDLYDVGDTVRLTLVFKAGTYTVASGVPAFTYALANPTAISLTVETPAGVQATYTYAAAEITRQETGVFYRDQALTAAGEWRIKGVGTGAVAAVVEWIITVQPQLVD